MFLRKLAILCWLLGSMLLMPAALAQDDTAARQAAIAAAQVVLGRRPETWTYTIGFATDDASLGCPLIATGTKLGRSVVPYRYEFVYQGGQSYVVYVASDGSLVQLCDSKFNTPVQVSPTPTLLAGVTPTSTPFGTPAPTLVPNLPATLSANIGLTLQQYPCPVNYTGYMPPRIRNGAQTAAIEAGGVPNKLRSLPSTDNSISQQVGQIQPSRVLNFVLSGPACSGGYVWWYVEVDGVRGWTAESNFAENDYYIEPTAGNAATPSAPNVILSTPSSGGQLGGFSAAQGIDASFRLLEQFRGFAPFAAYRNDGQALYAFMYFSATPIAGTGTLLEYDAFSLQQTGRSLIISDVAPLNLQVSSLGDLVFSMNDGSIRVYNPNLLATDINQATLSPVLSIPNALSVIATSAGDFALSRDGRSLATFGCQQFLSTGGCVRISVRVFDLLTGALRYETGLPSDSTNMTMGTDLHFSADGTRLFAIGAPALASAILDATTGVILAPFNTDTLNQLSVLSVNNASNSLLSARCKLPAQSCGGAIEVGLWNNEGGLQGVLDVQGGDSPVLLETSDDGARFILSDVLNNLWLFSDSGLLLAQQAGAPFRDSPDAASFTSADFSPDGRFIVLTTRDARVVIWDVQAALD